MPLKQMYPGKNLVSIKFSCPHVFIIYRKNSIFFLSFMIMIISLVTGLVCVCVCVCVCVKSLQLCPSLCDPMDCSPPGYSILGFSSKNTGVDCHALLQDIFLIQGSNLHLLCLLLWQVYSLPIALPGKAICRIFLRLGFLDTDFAS